MKSCDNGWKLLITLLLVGLFLSRLNAQNANDIEKAEELYNKGNVELDSKKYEDALTNFKKSYSLYKHSEIAFAICLVYSLQKKYELAERYAILALDGNPMLNENLEKNALELLKLAKKKQKPNEPDGLEFSATSDKPVIKLSPKNSKDQQLTGVYTIQQKSNNRYWDAHEYKQKGFALVTRPLQNNDTQKWIIKPVSYNVYTIQQKSNHRYVDAYKSHKDDYALMTQPFQNNDTQKWIIRSLGDNEYIIQQMSNRRYV